MYIKARKRKNKVAASNRDKLLSPLMMTNHADAITAKGISLRTVVRKMVIGATSDATPTMSKVLKTLLPTTLPTAKSGVPFTADTRLTQNSGIDVPIATTVRPIIICGIHNRSAMPTAPSVSLSAPHNTRAMPPTIIRIFSNMISLICFLAPRSGLPVCRSSAKRLSTNGAQEIIYEFLIDIFFPASSAVFHHASLLQQSYPYRPTTHSTE